MIVSDLRTAFGKPGRDALLGPCVVLMLFSGAVQVSSYLFLGRQFNITPILMAVSSAWSLMVIARSISEFPANRATLACLGSWLLFVLWVCTTASWTTSPLYSTPKVLALVVYSSLFYVMGMVVSHSHKCFMSYRYTVIALGIVTAVASAIAVQRLAGATAQSVGATGTLAFFLKSYQTTTFCISVASAFSLIEALAAQRAVRAIWLVIWIVLTFMMFVGGGRGALLGSASAQIIILLFASVHRTESHVKRGARGLLIALPVIVAIISLIAVQMELETMTRILYAVSSSTDTTQRIELWNKAIDMAIAFPVFGGGLGSFEGSANTVAELGIYPHNLFIEALAETGFVGLVLFVTTLVMHIVSVARRTQRLDWKTTAQFVAIAGIVLFLINVSGDLKDRFLPFVLGCCTGLVARADRPSARSAHLSSPIQS